MNMGKSKKKALLYAHMSANLVPLSPQRFFNIDKMISFSDFKVIQQTFVDQETAGLRLAWRRRERRDCSFEQNLI